MEVELKFLGEERPMESSVPCTEKIRLFVRVWKSYWIYLLAKHTTFAFYLVVLI